MNLPRPTLIAHRGNPSTIPEHTIEGYKLAIKLGADMIEPDVVITKDGILIIRHENEISGTTNIEDFPEFMSRKCTKIVDGESKTGVFTEDLTLQEIKLLRAKERIPDIRPGNREHDGKYPIPTLQEVVDLMKESNLAFQGSRKIGIYPETKHSSYFRKLGLPLEERLVELLEVNDLNKEGDLVFIQSFEVSNLKHLRLLTKLSLVQLIDEKGAKPFDFVLNNDSRTYEDLVTVEGLAEIRTYADVVAPHKEYLIPRTSDNNIGKPTDLLRNAHSVGLLVHAWTFRPENHFLPDNLKSSQKPEDKHLRGSGSILEIQAFLEEGLDGFFSDSSDIGRKAIDSLLERKKILPI